MNAVKPIRTKTGPGKSMDQLMNKNAGKEAYKKHWWDAFQEGSSIEAETERLSQPKEGQSAGMR